MEDATLHNVPMTIEEQDDTKLSPDEASESLSLFNQACALYKFLEVGYISSYVKLVKHSDRGVNCPYALRAKRLFREEEAKEFKKLIKEINGKNLKKSGTELISADKLSLSLSTETTTREEFYNNLTVDNDRFSSIQLTEEEANKVDKIL